MKRKINFRKLALLAVALFLIGSVAAQNVKVTGKITDVADEAVIGATIKEVGTHNAVVSDVDGNYSINVKQNGTLEFSFVGYKTVVEQIAGRTSINVQLVENVVGIDEIVVIGYGSARKQDLSVGIATMTVGETLKSRPSSLSGIMQGQLPGVTVMTNGGDPLAGSSILIRGRGSRGGDGVLTVVDGVPGAPYNVEDIETITVLKDAASAAIYGASVGSGGVIVITTKKAKAGRISVDFNFQKGFKQAWNTPNSLTAEQYNQVWAKASEGAKTPIPTVADPAKFPYGGVTRTDWINEIFQNAPVDHYAVSISGGSEKFSALMSFSYDKEQGLLKNTYYEKMGGKLNVSFSPTSWLKVTENVSFIHTNGQGAVNTESHQGVLLSAIFYPRSATVYEQDANGQYVLDSYGNPKFGGTIPEYLQGKVSGYGEIRNPVATLARLNQNRPSLNLISTTGLEIKPIKHLTLKTDFTVQLNTQRVEEFNPRIPEYGLPSGQNSYTVSSNWNPRWYWESTATYSRTFNDKHYLSAVAGYIMSYEQSRASTTYTYNYMEESQHLIDFINAGDWNKTRPTMNRWEESMISVLGRVAYSYDDRYFLTASVRRDATSKLHPSNNSGVFPSVSASWKVSSEKFFEPLKSTLNFLKIRASWGQIGNVGLVPRYSYNVAMTGNSWPTFYGPNGTDEVYGKFMGTLINPSLTWETTEQLDLGLDLGLFNDALEINVDYFNKTTKNLIEQIAQPSQAGVQTDPYGNVGRVSNKGWDFNAIYRKNFGQVNFSVNANFGLVESVVEDLGNVKIMTHTDNVNSLQPLRSAVGQPWFSYHLIKADGIFKTDQEAAAYMKDGKRIQPNAKAGDIKFVDLNGDGIINDNDKEWCGSYLPKLTYAFGFNVEWKGIDLSVFFQGVEGIQIFNGFKLMGLTGRSQGNNMLASVMDSFEFNPNSGMPRLGIAEDPNSNFRMSDFFLEDGSYLRLKNVTIGYTLPVSVMKSIGLPDARWRIYLSGENLLTFTKYTGFDPEVGRMGLDGGRYPVARSYMLGLSLKF